MSAKLLKAVFVILLLVTIAEAGYYFYVLKKGNFQQKNNTANNSIQQMISSESANKDQENPQLKKFQESILIYQNLVKNNTDGKVYFVMEQPGVINSISTKEEGTFITINNYKGERIAEFTINDKIKFYQIKNNEKIQISPQDLKINDKIIMRVEINMLTNKETVEFILYDLKV